MKYHLLTTKRFDKAVKKCLARGYDLNKLRVAMSLLEERGSLPATYAPHKLKGYGKNNQYQMEANSASIFLLRNFS